MVDTTLGNSSANFGTPGLDLDEVRRWISTLHGDNPGLIWVGSTSNWEGFTASDVDGAVANVRTLERDNPQGIYLRTTTLSRIPLDRSTGRRGRGGEIDSFTLPGFAADLDIAGPGHKTSKILPPDAPTAMSIVTESGLPEPTIWVHSGGGLYPWWLLEDPVDLRDPDVLALAKELSEKIQKILVYAGEKLGWHVGGEVGDMARILRIPGTINRKEGLARPCHIIEPPSYQHYAYAELDSIASAIFDAIPKPAPREFTKTTRPMDSNGGQVVLPGDDLNARGDWSWILQGHFEYVETKGGTDYWLRVGSTSGARHSATTGHARDEDRFYTWSPESVFEPRVPYNKHAAYTLINFGSLSAEAFRQSTKLLAAEGFGTQLPKFDHAPNAMSLVRPAAQVPVTVKPVDDQEPAQAVLAVEANQALPVLGHNGLPSLGSQVYTSQHWDDMGLVSMYSSTFCGVLQYLDSGEEWKIWDGKRWTRDNLGRAFLASRKMLTGILDYARDQEKNGNEHGKDMVKAAVKLATLNRVNAIVNVAKRDECVAARPQDFDTHKDLVTVENGVLNLRTGELTDFNPDLKLTKKIKATYDRDAKGPRTIAFLESIQPDPEVLAYMKRLVGATVLGNADERVLPIIHGASGSGKSAFLEMLYHVLADFAAVADPTTLMPQPDNYQGPSEKLHSLMGTRFVKMSELPENASLNQALVKSITGSDTQKTRPLYGQLQEWQVEYVVWMATNNLPKITSTDGAIWKRVKPIHFPNVFVNEDGSTRSAGDRDLGRQLARDEGSFILNWILEGIAEYREHGLAEPAQIGAWLTGYRDEMDTTRQFVTEAQENGQIKVEEGQTIQARDLYRIYLAWAADAQIKFTLSAQTFKQRMQVNGHEQVRVASGMVWKGIGVAGFIGQATTPSQGNQWMGRQRQ